MKKYIYFLGRRPLALGCLFIYILFLLYSAGVWPKGGLPAFYQNLDKRFPDTTEIRGSGQLISKTFKTEYYQYAVKQDGLTLLLLCKEELPIGAHIAFSGKVKGFSKATNDGGFDEENYYRASGYDLRIEAMDISVIKRQKFPLRETLYKLRRRIESVYESCLNAEEPGIMSALTVGNKAELSSDVKDFFKAAGLLHILAISGLHISLVGTGLYRLLRKRKVSFVLAAMVSGSIVGLYATMTGWSISARRAVFMYMVYMLSQILGAAYDLLTSLGIAAVISMFTGRGISESASFIFSYAAILGVSYISNMQRIWFGNKRDFTTKVLKRITFSIMMTVFLMPVTAYYYYELPLLGVLSSLLLLPLVAPLLLLGLAGGLIGILSLKVGSTLLYPCHLILYVMEAVSDFIKSIKGSNLINVI